MCTTHMPTARAAISAPRRSVRAGRPIAAITAKTASTAGTGWTSSTSRSHCTARSTAKALTPSGITAAGKVYDGNTDATTPAWPAWRWRQCWRASHLSC